MPSSPHLLGDIVAALALAGTLHLVIRRVNVLHMLAVPIGRELFGANKTWRGVLVMTLLGALIFPVLRTLHHESFTPVLLLQGALLGLGYVASELPNSFVKRRMGISEGRTVRGTAALLQYLADQTDSVLGVTVIAFFLFGLDASSVLTLVIAGTLTHIIIDFLAHETGLRRRTGPTKRFILSQIIIFCCCKIIFRAWNRTTVRGIERLEALKEKVPVIIAANHRNRFDSYLIAGAMPWRYFSRLLPKRYMTAAEYMNEPGLGHFLLWCGAYTTAPDEDGKTHYRSKEMLQRGESILMYPEGKMTQRMTGGEQPRVGVMWIARGVPGTHILPLKIDSVLKVPIPALLRGGQTFTVTFGTLFEPVFPSDDLQPQVNRLMDDIYALS